MKEKLKQFIEEKGIRKWFQRDNFIIIILSGVLILIISLPTKDTQSGDEASKPREGSASVLQEAAEQTESTADSQTDSRSEELYSLSEYETMMEARLEQLLEGMAGVGKVKVMITLASSEELVVEKDRPITRANTTESDGEGGSRSIYQTDSKETTVYQSEGTESRPYVIKTLMPQVEGVVVAAQGAGTGEVSKNITEAVQALFDLEANQVKVIKMKVSE